MILPKLAKAWEEGYFLFAVTGKDDTPDTTKDQTHAVVMKWVEGLKHKGHHLYCDNFYSSPDLFVDI